MTAAGVDVLLLESRQRTDGRLHWSATETSRASPEHIKGAPERAETVAAQIIDDLDQRNAA